MGYDLVRIQVGFSLQVGKLQKQFIVKLLGQSSFSKHLSAVRETNNLLMRALDLRNTDDGNSIKVPTISMPVKTIPELGNHYARSPNWYTGYDGPWSCNAKYIAAAMQSCSRQKIFQPPTSGKQLHKNDKRLGKTQA